MHTVLKLAYNDLQQIQTSRALHFALACSSLCSCHSNSPAIFPPGQTHQPEGMLSLKMSRIELKSSDLLEYEELKLKKQQTSSEKGNQGESVHMATEGHTTPQSSAKSPSAQS